jgi:electron-transferring-flavoprotein dehydrogenase
MSELAISLSLEKGISHMPRETMDFDIVIVGAGPAGLTAAIRLAQLSRYHQRELSIAVIEKAAEVGAHTLSGAILDPRALNQLFPAWQSMGSPLSTPVTEDEFLWLTATKSRRLPTPPTMSNKGNYIISLGEFCRWLAKQAEQLEVSIFAGFTAIDMVYDEDGTVCGIITGDMGLDKNGEPSARFQPGIEILAKQTFLAEGCHGFLSQQMIERFALRDPEKPQTYAIGIKELWKIPKKQHQPGRVIHSVGWPLKDNTYGGSFLYHWGEDNISVGFVVGLDYQNPYLDPFEELQRFKTHPAIRDVFAEGERLCYGARALCEGGFQSLPKLTFPGGLLIGDAAGFLNVPRLKGTHYAMESAIIAAETVFAILPIEMGKELDNYTKHIELSPLYDELYRARNIRPAFRWGLKLGLAYAALDTYIFKGKAPWTFEHVADHSRLKPASKYSPIDYPKPDGKITFDKLSSVYLANIQHREDQPCHLILRDPQLAIDVNYKTYASPETRYCPAKVYEIIMVDGAAKLQINSSNCIHCKTCDIKDPKQNIFWAPPEGGSGPNYVEM